jgi:hypothetical protein
MQTPWGSEVYDLSGLAPSNSKSEQGQANDFFRFILVNLLMQLLMPPSASRSSDTAQRTEFLKLRTTSGQVGQSPRVLGQAALRVGRMRRPDF